MRRFAEVFEWCARWVLSVLHEKPALLGVLICKKRGFDVLVRFNPCKTQAFCTCGCANTRKTHRFGVFMRSNVRRMCSKTCERLGFYMFVYSSTCKTHGFYTCVCSHTRKTDGFYVLMCANTRKTLGFLCLRSVFHTFCCSWLLSAALQ